MFLIALTVMLQKKTRKLRLKKKEFMMKEKISVWNSKEMQKKIETRTEFMGPHSNDTTRLVCDEEPWTGRQGSR